MKRDTRKKGGADNGVGSMVGSAITDTDRINWIDANCRDELNNPCWLLENPDGHKSVRAWIDSQIEMPNKKSNRA